MQINRQNLKWAGRMMLIILLVAVADGLVGAFARKPLPWVAVIPALIPVLTCVFVVLPIIRADKSVPPGV
jgi:hypothetical protein